MDQHKIDNFLKANPVASFPSFVKLSPDECSAVRAKVAEKLGLDAQAPPLQVVKALSEKVGRELLGHVPEEGNPDLSIVLPRLPRGTDDVLVNWYRFDDIDRLNLNDLFAHFDDIWYPGVDDIEIFDDACKWFLFVSHDGVMDLLTM